MNAVISLCAAFGLVVLYGGLTAPSTPRRRVTHRLERALIEAGLGWSPGRLLASSAMLGVISSVAVAGVLRSAPMAAMAGVLGARLPFSWLGSQRRRRRDLLREAWPDAIADLVSGIRSGTSLPEACAALAERGSGELASSFEAFRATYRATGSFQTALARVGSVAADPVADRVVAALRLAHEIGGSELVSLLRALSEVVREDLRIRKEVGARWSWTVTSARVAAAAPWIVLLLMATRPEAIAAYNSPAGITVLVGGAVATALGYRLMLLAARLPEERGLR